MRTVGVEELKDHLDDYLRLAQRGEGVLIVIQGEVVAELRSSPGGPGMPPGLQELVRRGMTRGVVPNDPALYRPRRPALERLTAQELIDWDRADR